VFDPDEQVAIRSAADGDLEVWARWAAKETGFKVVSKLIGTPPPFVHRAFKVEWTRSGPDASPSAGESSEGRSVREGRVTYEGYEVQVWVQLWSGAVHAVGFGAPREAPADPILQPRLAELDSPGRPWTGSLEELKVRFTDRERDAVYSRESAAVRLGARSELARALEVDERRVEIVCDPGTTGLRPPRVFLDDERAAADVSLSHDGRWIAWVLWTDNAEDA
jgi:hypothetical protein